MHAQICQILLPWRVPLVFLRQECIKWIERVVGVGEGRNDAGISHIAYKNQVDGISIVQTGKVGGISIMVSELNPPLIPPLAGGDKDEGEGEERRCEVMVVEVEEIHGGGGGGGGG